MMDDPLLFIIFLEGALVGIIVGNADRCADKFQQKQAGTAKK
jgi:hypothetical protein